MDLSSALSGGTAKTARCSDCSDIFPAAISCPDLLPSTPLLTQHYYVIHCKTTINIDMGAGQPNSVHSGRKEEEKSAQSTERYSQWMELFRTAMIRVSMTGRCWPSVRSPIPRNVIWPASQVSCTEFSLVTVRCGLQTTMIINVSLLV